METVSFFNWVDYVMISLVVWYALQGGSKGLIGEFINFVFYVIAFTIGLILYPYVSSLIILLFPVSKAFANPISFLCVVFISTVSFFIILSILFPFVRVVTVKNVFLARVSKGGGMLFATASFYVIASFFFMVLVSFPISAFLTQSISSSGVGGIMLGKTQIFEKNLNEILGRSLFSLMNFFTVSPHEKQSYALLTTNSFVIDKAYEQKMFKELNRERALYGMFPLVLNGELSAIARTHAKDMVKREYFSHYSPEGKSPSDRIRGGVFGAIGENLAIAPNVDLAMRGFMQSSEHRRNLLSPRFRNVGIAALDTGKYGIVFAQEFTD